MRVSISGIGPVSRRVLGGVTGVPLLLAFCLLALCPSWVGGSDPLLPVNKPVRALAPEAVLTKVNAAGAVLLRTTGSSYEAYAWAVSPVEADVNFLKLKTEDGEPIGLCFYPKDFTVVFSCGAMDDGKLRLDVAVVHVARNGPDPKPDPDPDPDPPPGVAEFCVIIEEKDDRTKLPPEQVFIFESKKLRALFPKGAVQIRDDDIKGAGAGEWQLYIKRAREIGLPVMFLATAIDESTNTRRVLWEGPVPKNVPATIKVVQEYQ